MPFGAFRGMIAPVIKGPSDLYGVCQPEIIQVRHASASLIPLNQTAPREAAMGLSRGHRPAISSPLLDIEIHITSSPHPS